jgi:uncharacterized protein with von Willebrand factor type A (vWA) domain
MRSYGLPVSMRELLVLLEAIDANACEISIDEFYLLARTVMVKDEALFDRFDRAFKGFYEGISAIPDDGMVAELPEDWLKAELLRNMSEEEKAKLESMGGLEALMERLKELLEEQKERHEGGKKWIGTGGSSPFGHSGYNPEGMRIGGPGKEGKAVKSWDQRDYRNLDDQVEIGTRNIKLALRKLRKFARTGATEELDLDKTIRSTANNAGLLDIHMQRERHNAVKVLLLLDVGGSMDSHVKVCEELFSACRAEFKRLESFYFHNFVYDYVWNDNKMRRHDLTSTWDLIHTFSKDYKVIFVGDAAMSPYEVNSPYGSIDFNNNEAGQVWFQRLSDHFRNIVWLNPVTEDYWSYTTSTKMIRELTEDRMYPLTIDGIGRAIDSLQSARG